jgi:hypothetical protein
MFFKLMVNLNLSDINNVSAVAHTVWTYWWVASSSCTSMGFPIHLKGTNILVGRIR